MTTMTPAAPKLDPINPGLYSLLQHKFKDIKIANAGVPAIFDVGFDPITGRRVKRASSWGEYYTVCCPFCNDVGNKLWINHLYGNDYDKTTGRRTDTHLACCYKNDCLKVPGRYEQLEDIVFGAGRKLTDKLAIKVVDIDTTVHKTEQPGKIISLLDLPKGHDALEYLISRQFDPVYLAQQFDIGFCSEALPAYPMMNNRIYIPIKQNNELVGWQGRLTHDMKKAFKYYNEPAMKKSRVLYNYDTAAEQPFVIVVEGIPSVWRIGAPAVALLGKSLSAWQLNTLVTTWAGKPIFLVLDREAAVETEKAFMALCRHSDKVIPVILPDDRDPGDYVDLNEFRALLKQAAIDADIEVEGL